VVAPSITVSDNAGIIVYNSSARDRMNDLNSRSFFRFMRLAQVMLVSSTNPSTVKLTLNTTVDHVNELLQIILDVCRYLAHLVNRYIVRR
jgi:hypothetical protein